MSQATIRLAQGWFERWNRGDRFLPEEIHPDVELITQLQPPLHGHDGFRRWITEIDEQFEEWRLVPEEWREAGDDRVLALGHIHIRGHGSGVEFDQPMGWVIEVEAEKLRRIRTFLDHAAAIETAGAPAEPDAAESELIAELRRGYAAFNRGDYDRAVTANHPDMELIPAGGQPPIRGAKAVRAWMEPDAFESQVVESAEFTQVGNRVLVRNVVHARGSGSGIEMNFEMWAVWTAGDDGRWIRVEIFLPHEEARARAAAGLAD
jgi:ketosteroid isomerase-like protein